MSAGPNINVENLQTNQKPDINLSGEGSQDKRKSLDSSTTPANAPGSGRATKSVTTAEVLKDIDSYFFEQDDVQLRKIDGIRLSLCMSLKILYRLSALKKKANCSAILEHEHS